MGLIAWSPLAGGLLAGALKKVDEGRRSEYLQDEIEKDRDRLERWEKVTDLGERPSDVALAGSCISRP